MHNVGKLINYSCHLQGLFLEGFLVSFLVLRPKEELDLKLEGVGKGPHFQNQKLQNVGLKQEVSGGAS